MPAHPSPLLTDAASRAVRRVLAVLGTALLAAGLVGCGLFGQKKVVWAYDETSGLYYMEHVRSQLEDPVRAHLPQLEDVTDVEATDATLSDPDAWFGPPALDDDVWQAVLTLGPDEVEELAEEIAAAEPGIGAATDPPTEDSLHDALVPTLDDLVGRCAGGWVDATTALAGNGSPNVTESGRLLQHAAFCEDSGQLVIELREM